MNLKPPVIAGQPTPVPSLPSTLSTTGVDPNTILVKFQAIVIGLTSNAAIDGIALSALLLIIYAIMNMFSGGSSNVTKNDKNNARLTNTLISAGIIAAAGIFVQIAVGFGHLLTT